MQVLPAGPDALLVELPLPAEVPLLYADLRRDLTCADLVPGARTVLLDGVADLDGARDYLSRWVPAGGSADRVGPLVELPTTYDGADLDDVARRWGMTRAEAVATHSGAEHTVAFVGFAPGFAYCTGLPPELAVPRLDRPRAKVPSGAVGLAGEYTGVYPTASPGGWRLVGRTDARLWDADRDEPALLTPGTRVRFVEVSG
jgi:KipI family sensor histidine kinase inhibitor